MIHIGNRKWDFDYQMYFQTSSNCTSWSAFAEVPHGVGKTIASATATPQIVYAKGWDLAYLIAAECIPSGRGHCWQRWEQSTMLYYWRYNASTGQFGTWIQQLLSPNDYEYSTDLLFGAAWHEIELTFGMGFLAFSQANRVDKNLKHCTFNVNPDEHLSASGCQTFSSQASEQGYSAVYYQDDPNSRYWWTGFVPIGSVSGVPYSTNSNSVKFGSLQVPLIHAPQFSFPLDLNVWSGVTLEYTYYYDGIVAALASGAFD
jgi:hypothetical protein